MKCYSVNAERLAQPHDLSLALIESKTASFKPVTDICHTPLKSVSSYPMRAPGPNVP